jgi:NADH-quinone oxidoreductase subunit I
MTDQRDENPIRAFLGGFAAVFQGMWVTLVNLLGRKKITVQYPYERAEVSPRYRGLFYLPYDEEAKRLKCVGCTLCEQACPTNVISMVKLGAGKHAGVSEFDMDLGRCMFCNLCIEACPFDAIYMGPIYEIASTRRDASIFRIADLTPGGRTAVETNNATIEAALAEEAERKRVAAEAAGTGEHAAPTAHKTEPEA